MKLPEIETKGKMSLEEAILKRRSRRKFDERPLDLKQLSQLLWSVQGKLGEKRSRAVPSAGATFPLEVYAVVGNVEGVEAGLYRYDIEKHAIDLIGEGDLREALCGAALSQKFIAQAPATIVIAADYIRTSQRYGERAERYVHMEVGHAGQNVYLECESLGLGTCAVGAFDDAAVKAFLRIEEEPLYLLPVGYAK